ncbi:MAG: prepilin-type N-terminal cleavage/methylation domain-containing protein [Candidatus Gracilibacteria bacterium]|nr:prepilin-type N-terminal cleavage/methylation domain-containing protein [Candidatus Gracilibacteria bacterium]
MIKKGINKEKAMKIKKIKSKLCTLTKLKIKGFTLVEIIVVMVIIILLGTISLLVFTTYNKSARNGVRVTDAKNIEDGLNMFFADRGRYPEPDSFTILSGGTVEIKQGIIGENVVRAISLNDIPLDPKLGVNYTYSIFGNGKYYQIAYEKESFVNQNPKKVNADNINVSVEGNYKFDPSFPSLVLIKDSVGTSGIFDPNVCFITNGGENKLDSKSGSCLKKQDLILKDYDDTLVGYWDMQTLSGTLLKDLSGNGNNGTGSGGIIIGGTGGKLGNGTYFDGTNDFIDFGNNDVLNVENISISIITRLDRAGTDFPRNEYFLTKGEAGFYTGSYLTGSYYLKVNNSNILGPSKDFLGFGYSSINDEGYIVVGGQSDDKLNWANSDLYNNSTFYNVVTTCDSSLCKIFKNGILIYSQQKIDIINKSDSTLLMGRNNSDVYPRWLKGYIDEVKIYNRALSEKEVLQQAKIAGY